jgi:hypothetical protein
MGPVEHALEAEYWKLEVERKTLPSANDLASKSDNSAIKFEHMYRFMLLKHWVIQYVNH